MAAHQFNQTLGKVIREFRVARKLSQEQLGFEAGVARQFVSLMELGRHSPTVERFERMAQALGVSGSYLLAQAELRHAKRRTSKS